MAYVLRRSKMLGFVRASAKPARGTTMHTSQQSSEVDAAAAVDDFNAAEVAAAGQGHLTGLVLAAAASAVAFPSQSPPSHTSVRIAAPASVLSGTLLRTLHSSSAK